MMRRPLLAGVRRSPPRSTRCRTCRRGPRRSARARRCRRPSGSRARPWSRPVGTGSRMWCTSGRASLSNTISSPRRGRHGEGRRGRAGDRRRRAYSPAALTTQRRRGPCRAACVSSHPSAVPRRVDDRGSRGAAPPRWRPLRSRTRAASSTGRSRLSSGTVRPPSAPGPRWGSRRVDLARRRRSRSAS